MTNNTRGSYYTYLALAKGWVVLLGCRLFETAQLRKGDSTYSPKCTSVKELLISIRWYLGYLRG